MTIDLKAVDAPSWQREPARTAILSKSGFTPPAEHAAIAERLAAFKALGDPVTARLIHAVVTGEGDVEALRAGALAEWNGDAHRLSEIVGIGVAEAQGRIVGAAAAETYKAVQARFNAAATSFAKSAALADGDAPAEEIIAQGDLKVQKAWQDAAKFADELDGLLVPLLAAATNAGIPHPAGKDTAAAGSRNPKTKAMVLGLVVDATGVENIRTVWDALDSERRTGPWGQFLRVGAKIHAKELADYEPLRQPAPLVDRKILRSDGTYEFKTIDPEAPDHAESEELVTIAAGETR